MQSINAVSDSRLAEDKDFLEYRKSGDRNLRNTIAEKYLYIAEIMAKKFVNKGVDYEDLLQIASLALIKAVERFDPDKGVKFSTFATPSIIGEIKNYFRDKVRMINPGRKNNQLILQIRKAVNELSVANDRVPSAEEVAKYLNADAEQVIEAMEYNNAVISLDNTLDDNETPLYEVIPDTCNIFEKIDNHNTLAEALSRLTAEERSFIEKRFIHNISQSKIAEDMNVSQMFVSRLEKKIINKLKNMFEIA